jgi:tetratricopeptide (TPR) repeat protein
VPGARAPAPTKPPPAAAASVPRPRSTRIDTEPDRPIRSALFGRNAQLSTLRDAVTRAIDFQTPQLVTIVGNQGTGKTRLINELIGELREKQTRVYHGAAEKNVKLSAIASLLRARFELTPVPDEMAKLRFTHEVRDVLGSDQIAEMGFLIASFVGLEFLATPFLRALIEDPAQQAQLTKTALRRFIEGDAAKSPLVLVLDDLHWAGEETLELIHDLAGHVGGPVVLLCAARPEMLVRMGGWGEGDIEHTRIDLRNLEGDDAEGMLKDLVRAPRIPDDIIEGAIEMTGGNPAFLEQLVKLYIDHGALAQVAGGWLLDADRAAEIELPVSVDEAIEARIAALEPEERDLLEKAAVFGNVFWLSAVIALTRLEKDPPNAGPLELEWGHGEDVRRRVSDLVSILADRDYVLMLDSDDSSVPGDVEVVFKHNLERELIAKSIEPRKVARYYLAAAQWLESKLSTLRDEQLEFLASLYERGGDTRRAARCYLQGGDRARARYSPDEARTLYEKGLAMLGETDAPARLDGLHNLGDVLEQSGRTDEAAQRFGEMLSLAWRFDSLNKAGAAYSRLARGQRRLGKYDTSMEHLRRAQELFERSRDDRGIASTLDDMGRVHWLRGGYGQALDFHRQALTIRRALGDRRSIALSLANIGRVHHDSGNFKAAIAQFREALELRRDIGDLVGIVQSLCDLGGVQVEQGNHEQALELLAEARNVAQDIGDKMALADVLSRAGEVKGAVGRGADAVKDLSDAKQLASQLGDRVALAVTHQRLAQVHLHLGNLEAADGEAQAAVTTSQSVGLRVHIGCAYRVKAEVSTALGRMQEAEDDFRRAIDILATVKHEVELARAYQGFASLKERAGNAAEAQKLRSRANDIFHRLRGAAQAE